MSAKPSIGTGVGRAEGIGFEICRQLARWGMTVLLTARDLVKAEASARLLAGEGLQVRPYGLDVTREDSVRQLAQQVERELGRLDGSGILVNAVCPGLTATAPGMEAMGARPVADGAAGVVWAATLPDDGPSGGFFRDGRPVPW